MTGIISPHTRQPVPSMNDGRIARAARAKKAAPPEPKETPEQTSAKLASRYRVAPGKLVVAREKVSGKWSEAADIAMTDDRLALMKTFNPWGTILLVGEPYITESGTVIKPDPEWVAGRRVLVAPTGATDVDLQYGDSELTVSLVGFRAIHLVDMGEPA